MYVGAQILGRDVDDLESRDSRSNHIPDPVVLYVDMLGALMVNRILRKLMS